MTTISGAAVAAPTTITFLQLTQRIEKTLSGQNYGTNRWERTRVQAWLQQAIRNYSIRFPVPTETTISTTSGTTQYALPALFVAALSVRDATADTPTYYHRKPHNGHNFWSQSQVYDITGQGSQTAPPEIWLPNISSTTITIEYHSEHTWNLDDGDAVTVPTIHFDILELYVIWQAWTARRETAVVEFTTDDIAKEEFDRISGRTYATRLDYFTAVSQALQYQEGKAAILQWSSDELERIY